MTEFTQFPAEQVSGQPAISEELTTLLTAATVHRSILDGFRALGIATCGRFASLADDVSDLREALSEMFNVDKKHGPLHRLEGSKLGEVWSQAKARTETQQKVDSTARAHGMPVELPAGSWGNLVKAFQDKYGSAIPLKDLPAQSYFEVLEEMVQDRLLHAEPLSHVVSMETENKHRLSNPDSHSSHIAMLFDGSTIRPKRRLTSSMPGDLESFRTKYEIIANVWRMMKIRSPGRSVLEGLTGTHLGVTQTMADGFEKVRDGIGSGSRRHEDASWALCITYEQKVREATMDLIRMQGLPLAEALERVRNDSEHRMFHWVQVFSQPGQQKSLAVSASSSGSSNAPKHAKAAHASGQYPEYKAISSKIDKLASSLKMLADRVDKGERSDRSRTPKPKKAGKGKGSQAKGKGKGKGKAPLFTDLLRNHKDKFVLKREGQEVCFAFQDDRCNDQGCVRAHVCAACGRNTSWKQCKCMNLH